MNHRAPTAFVLSTLLLGTTGCKEYFSVDEACDDNISGDKDLLPLEVAGMLRMNCHRRLAGMSKASANGLVQQEARNVLEYIVKNPSTEFLNGLEREYGYKDQLSNNPGFSGISVRDRLTSPDTGVGYVYYDELTTATREFYDIHWSYDTSLPVPTGAAAVDFLMKDQEFRQLTLQGDWIDGAFAEVALSPEWFANAGFLDPLPTSGRAFYGIQMYTEPHFEHANEPVVYPKEDQTDVPLWAYTHMPVDPAIPTVYTQLGYPITFNLGATDPVNFFEIEFNQYRGTITNAALVGPDGESVDLYIVYPGLEANGTMPDGQWTRTILAAYPTEALQPASKYRFRAKVTTPGGEWEYDFQFTTTSEGKDPGFDPLLQALEYDPPTTGSSSL